MTVIFSSLTESWWLAHPVLLLPAVWLCTELPGGHQLPHVPAQNQGLPGPAGQSALYCPVSHEPLTLEVNLKMFNLKSLSLLAGLPLQRQPALSGLQLSPAVCADLLCHSHRPQGRYMILAWCFQHWICTYFIYKIQITETTNVFCFFRPIWSTVCGTAIST